MSAFEARQEARGVWPRAIALLLCLLAASAAAAGAAPAHTAPAGIDVSHWNGQIDWQQVGAAGYDFVFAKATEGTTVSDPTYPLNRTGAGSAGIRFGGYHLARPAGSSDAAVTANAIAQADAFLAFAQPQAGDLLPVLDLEKTGSLSTTSLNAWTRAWLDEVAARLGVRAIVYASPHFWQTALGDTPLLALAGDRLWIAHWTHAALPILPGAGWGGLGWTFWQWTDCEKVPGIAHCVDGDRLNGDSLAIATIPAYPAAAPTVSATPTIIGTPQTGRMLAAVPGNWAGGKPVVFSYQWQSCNSGGAGCIPIAGATTESYVAKAIDAGHALNVSVTAQTAAGSAVASSLPTLTVAGSGPPPAAAPKPTVAPTISGTPQAGQTLSALPGTWSGATAFAYQWRRCPPTSIDCAAIPGAATSSYTITPDDIGQALSLTVTATGRGGSRSATTTPTTVVAPAPVPTAAAGSAIAQTGQAGAVATSNGVATASWQPGAVPGATTVALVGSNSRLALPTTSLTLTLSTTASLPWPLDLQYAAAPPDAVPGFLPGSGVWQPVAELPSPVLPAGQQTGAYRDPSGAFHLLTRIAGRIALFAPGKWGDPRFASAARPSLTLIDPPVATPQADGTVLLRARFTLDSQAHLYASVLTPGRRQVVLPQHGSRLGWWLQGQPTKNLQTLQLRPGAFPIRVRIPTRQLRAGGSYAVRIAAIDPYCRRSQLIIPFTPPR